MVNPAYSDFEDPRKRGPKGVLENAEDTLSTVRRLDLKDSLDLQCAVRKLDSAASEITRVCGYLRSLTPPIKESVNG